jgi:hypothetical protein
MAGKRILLVTGFFPPFSPLGAVRAPALVAHWQDQGYDVRVVAIDNPAIRGMLESPLPADKVVFAPFTNAGETLERLLRPLLRRDADAANESPAAAPPRASRPPRFQVVRRYYQHAVQFPDRYRNWIAPAVAAARLQLGGWQPDVIFSSGPPHSGHVVAGRLSRAMQAPWIAELRDTWANNPYSDAPRLIEAAQTLYANRVLRHAAAAVLLTRTAEAEVKAALGCPTIVSYNGFTAQDFAGLDQVAPLDRERLTILHAGVIYVGRRDPVSLFQALAIMGARRHRVRVKFYHDQMEAVARRAERLGVADCIEICTPVPRREILRIERQADVLLLCRWADPRDDGVIPGKLFEYIGARRPILAVGSTTGEATDIVREGDFGLVSNDPMAIARQLETWIAAKDEAGGRIPDLPEAPTRAYLREAQFRRIEPLLAQVTAGRGAALAPVAA